MYVCLWSEVHNVYFVIQPLHPEDPGLELAEQDYLDKAVAIDPESNQVTQSLLLPVYVTVFAKKGLYTCFQFLNFTGIQLHL